MASYPGAVWSPTTKNNGDTIQASHINDLQNEVVAIEDGLLNAKAPLNSSNSTVNALSVTNGSTLNTVSVSGGSTFAGNVVVTGKLQSSNSSVNNLTVAGTLTVTQGRTTCELTHTAIQNIPSGGAVGLSFDTEISDNGAMHSTSANSSRINFPVAGSYLIGATVNWSPGSTAGSLRFLGIKVNDATVLPGIQTSPFVSNASAHGMGISLLYTPASTSEYATVLVQQDSGSTMSISTGVTGLRAWAALVGI